MTADPRDEGIGNGPAFLGRKAQMFRDVRCGSVKRVAAAVGEGSACVQQVHQALRD